MHLVCLSKAVSDDVPDEYKASFHEAVDELVAQDWDDAGAEAIDTLILLVDDWDKLSEGAREVIVGLLGIVKGALAGLD